jgi:SAM-dependent methyltransferase
MFSESAELYDAIYSGFKDYAAESDIIARKIREISPNARTLLDVGCGTGEHVRHLRALGFRADGLDIDAELLSVARRKVPDATFFERDMRTFAVGTRYDVVACLFSSIGYLLSMDDVVAALQRFRQHLASDGIVVVEPWFTPGVLSAGHRSTRRAEVRGKRVERTSHTIIEGRVSTLEFEYLVESDGRDAERLREVHRLGLFTVEEMLAAFGKARLSVSHDPVGIFDNRGLYIGRAVA